MEHADVERLRERHPAWRLLRAGNAALVVTFLGRWFVDDHHGSTSAPELAAALDDELFVINAADPDTPRYPRSAPDYLEDWADVDAGWLRRFYPMGSDEVHYDATPAFEKAFAWVTGLRARPFVGTESRLHTVVELLRQIVHGAETDPQARLTELRRRRDAVNREIAEVEGGNVTVLSTTALRDRYQQFAATARDLLSDFREVEENFRGLDRAARERIAAWDGSKGDLLAQLVGSRADINSSDQGRSFQAFYDFLLSETRQDELAELLARLDSMEQFESDRRLRRVHHDWSEAAERTQRTVRQISEQLRRFLDDQVWLENRRVLDLVRSIERRPWPVATPSRPSGWRWTNRGSQSPYHSNGRSTTPARPPGSIACSNPIPTPRSTRAPCSGRRSSIRRGWPTTSVLPSPSAARRCWLTSSGCIRWSRVPPRSSGTSR